MKISGCRGCPLFIESSLGNYCAHPSTKHNSRSDPFAVLRADGLWVAKDWIEPPKEAPDRCPLRIESLVLEYGP